MKTLKLSQAAALLHFSIFDQISFILFVCLFFNLWYLIFFSSPYPPAPLTTCTDKSRKVCSFHSLLNIEITNKKMHAVIYHRVNLQQALSGELYTLWTLKTSCFLISKLQMAVVSVRPSIGPATRLFLIIKSLS